MHARIVGLGQWFPERIRENSDWPEEFALAARQRQGDRTLVDVSIDQMPDPCHAIAARYFALEAEDPFLGGCQRRIADPSMSSSEAEALAGRAALEDAGMESSEINAIFSWALVPDRLMPSNACRVARALGAERAWASTIDSACASPIAQLTLAASLIEAGRARSVLLTQSHLATRTFSMQHPASPCVGDGATAMVVTASERPGIRRTHTVTHGEHYDAVVWCRSRSAEEDAPWWESGGPCVMGSHATDAARDLMRNTVRLGVQTLRELFGSTHGAADNIAVLASVQPRRWVPAAIAEGFGLNPNVAPQTYERFGHLGGAGAVANLIAAREAGLLESGARAVVYAQGAGFTRGAVELLW